MPRAPARSRRASPSPRLRRVYVLIAGGGKIGANLARNLLRDGHGHEVTLIEQRRDRYERLEHEFEHQVQLGDATEIHVLDRAGIARPPDVERDLRPDRRGSLVRGAEQGEGRGLVPCTS